MIGALNPHNHLTALGPPGQPGRRWECRYCKMVGTFDELEAVACTYVYPPCESCGETPLCAPDCKGVAEALAGAERAGVHVRFDPSERH